MAEVTWFKVLTDIFADDKIKIIQSMPEGDSLLVLWFKVLSQAGKTNDGGYIYLRKNIPYTPAMLATLFNKPQMIVELALKTFTQFEMIDVDDNGYIFVTNWEKHQSIDKLNQIKEKTRLRVQNHRDKKKQELLESNVTVTLPKLQGNAIDIDVDLELDLDLKNTYIKDRIPELIEKYKVTCKGAYQLEQVLSYVGVISDELIEEGIKKSEGKNVGYLKSIYQDMIDNPSNYEKTVAKGSSTIARTGQAAKVAPMKPNYAMYADERNYDPL